MLPKDIVDIILKYQNFYEVEEINKSVKNIIKHLKQINNNISEQLYMLMNGIEVDSSEQQLLDDSRTIRNYISTIKLVSQLENNNTKSDAPNVHEDEDELYDKVYVNVTNDNLCPQCNVHLENHQINYKEKNVSKNVWWYICPCCEQFYCIENEVEDFDFNNTNIILNYCLDNSEPVYLIFTDIIILSTISACSYKNHNLKDTIANIPIFKENGTIDFIQKNISYCPQCNKYIMLKSDFKQIENIIACQVIDETITKENKKSDEIEIKQYESVLYRYGYNVKTKENISNKQRHLILASVVESGILTRQQICSHLDTLIERGSKIPKWKEATQKWRQDREYVKNYNPENLPEVLVDRVIAKYSQMRLF